MYIRRFLFFSILFISLSVTACKKKSSGGEESPSGYNVTLEITSISPDEGAPGTGITISGNGFSATASENTVTFNSIEAEVSSATASSLETSVPDGATSGKVSVTVDGETADGPSFTVLEPSAVITSVVPDSGKWGDKIIITGENFADFSLDNVVTFNGAEAIVLRSSETELMAEVPKGAGSGPVVVTVNSQPSEGYNFNYLLTVLVSTWAGGAEGYEDGPGTGAKFSLPVGIALDSEGNLYIGDQENHRIRKITPDLTRTVSTYAGTGIIGDTDGDALTAEFSQPHGMATGPDGELYVADYSNHTIRKITPGGTVSSLAGSGTAGYADGPGTTAQFYLPADVAVASDGRVFVADYSNDCIRTITSDGQVSTLAGNPSGSITGGGFIDGVGSDAEFDDPYSLALSPDESKLYVADMKNDAIRVITISTGEVSTLAGDGTADTKDGALDEARFNLPMGIAVDEQGTIFVTQFNHIIRMIEGGRVETIAGAGSYGYHEGEGTDAKFANPRHLAVNPEGTILYVSDMSNNRIRRITVE